MWGQSHRTRNAPPRGGLGRLAIAAVADHGDPAAVRAVLTTRMHIGRDATHRLVRPLRVAVLTVGDLTDQIAYALLVGDARLLQTSRVHRTRSLGRAQAKLLLQLPLADLDRLPAAAEGDLLLL